MWKHKNFINLQLCATFKHFFDAGTIGSGTVKFRHYSQTEPLPQLAAPQNVTANGTTVSWDEVENATSYEILVSGSSFGTVSTTSVDLSTLSGWASLTDGEYSVTIVAKADGYRDSESSAAVSVEKGPAVVMPIKGDIITLDSKQYRVLKTEGTVAEVLCMYDANSSIKFDSKSPGYNNTYAGKNIDTYCNNTFYSGLSAAIKSAIVNKTFAQDSWKLASSIPQSSHYTGKYGSSTYYLTLRNAAFGDSITRHCYVLSIQDILDYLGATTSMDISDTTLTDINLWKMFWNQTASPGSIYPWLRSASAGGSGSAFYVISGGGSLGVRGVIAAGAARPAFQIDLSKVEWSK